MWTSPRKDADSNRARFRRGLLISIAIGLSLLGLWRTGVIPDLPVPAPLEQVEAVQGDSDWALHGRTPAHTSAKDMDLQLSGEIAWKVDGIGVLRASPGIANGMILLATGDDRLLAIDQISGEVIWKRDLPLLTGSSPAITSNLAYLTLRTGELMAFNVRTGETKWIWDSPDAFFASAVVYRGVVYAASWSGMIRALDANSGQLLWDFETPGRIVAAPAFSDNLMAVTLDSGLVYVIDTWDGDKRLIYETGHVLTESPVFAEDRLLVSTGRGRIIAIDQSKLEYPFERGFRYWRQQFYIWRLQQTPPIPKGHVWSRRLGRDVAVGSATVVEDVAYLSTSAGSVYAIRIQTGDVLWEFDTGSTVHTSPAIAGKRVYVGTADGRLLALNRLTGTQEQTVHLKVALTGLVIPTDYGVYVTSRDSGQLIRVR